MWFDHFVTLRQANFLMACFVHSYASGGAKVLDVHVGHYLKVYKALLVLGDYDSKKSRGTNAQVY